MNQLSTAFIRAIITSVLSAITTGIATYQTGADETTIWTTALTAFVTPLLTRGAGEGAYDANREKNGQVSPADVGTTARAAEMGAANNFEGDVIPVQRELWAEVGPDVLQVVGIRTNRKTQKIDYLVQGSSNEPFFAKQVDRTFDKRPNRN